MEKYKDLFNNCLKQHRIKHSNQFFKISLFLEKAKNSLLIAKHAKDIKPSED
jgi:hypothetical protein